MMSKELRFPRINLVILTGRLTREVELRYTTNGTAVSKLSLAFDKSFKKNGEWVKETSYINCVVWDKLAIKCAEDLDKGSPILIEGQLKTDNYEDKTGNKRKSTEITAFKVHFLEKSEQKQSARDEFQNVKAPKQSDEDVPF